MPTFGSVIYITSPSKFDALMTNAGREIASNGAHRRREGRRRYQFSARIKSRLLHYIRLEEGSCSIVARDLRKFADWSAAADVFSAHRNSFSRTRVRDNGNAANFRGCESCRIPQVQLNFQLQIIPRVRNQVLLLTGEHASN